MSEEEEKEATVEENTEEQEEKQEEVPEEQAEEPSGEESEKPMKKTRKRAAKKLEKAEKAEESEDDVVAKGDFLLVEMTGRTIDTGEVFDTTDEETARTEGIYQEDRTYGPKLVVVGEGWVLKGLDDRLVGLKVEEAVEVEIPPEEAFGERSPDRVQTVPFRVLRSKGVNPVVGAQIEVDGRSAIVRSVGAGRVQLDYNHPRAGRKIVYEVKAVKRYEDTQDKIKAIIGRWFLGIDVDEFKMKMLKKKIRIHIPEEVFFSENIQRAKRAVANDIQRYFPHLEEVEYTEVIKSRT